MGSSNARGTAPASSGVRVGETPAQTHHITLGNAQLSVAGLVASFALASALTFLWEVFGYGLCDPTDGKGYLSIAVEMGMCAVAVLCTLIFLASRPLEALRHSQAFTLFVGVAVACAAFPAASGSGFVFSPSVQCALSLVYMCGISWCIYVCLCILAEFHNAFEIGILLHLSLVISFILHCIVMLNGDSSLWCALAFALLAPLSASLAVWAAWFCRETLQFNEEGFWIVGMTEAAHINESVARAGAKGTAPAETATMHPTNDHARIFGRLMIALFAFSLQIAFVRSCGLDLGDGMPSHSIGATPSLGIMAVFAVIMLGIMLYNCSEPPTREYYVAGGFGVAFAALVLLIPSQQNYFAVRVIENISYVLFYLSVLYSIMVYVHNHQLHANAVFARAILAIALGNAVGWALQMLIGSSISSSQDASFVLLCITLAVLACLMACSPNSVQTLLTPSTAPAPSSESQAAPTATFQAAEDKRTPVQAHAPAPTSEQAAPHKTPLEDEESRFECAIQRTASTYGLSKREVEILRLLVQGWSDQRIADALVCSYHTARSHIRHIYVKTDVHSRDELLDLINGIS